MLAIDTVTALMHSLARIVDRACGHASAGTPGPTAAADAAPVDTSSAAAPVDVPADGDGTAVGSEAAPRRGRAAVERLNSNAGGDSPAASQATPANSKDPDLLGALAKRGSSPAASETSVRTQAHSTPKQPATNARSSGDLHSAAAQTPQLQPRRSMSSSAKSTGALTPQATNMELSNSGSGTATSLNAAGVGQATRAESVDLRLSLAHASQLAQERMWAELVAPTEEHGRLLAQLLWQPALEVRQC